MSVEVLLNRLYKVRKTGAHQWVACCPAHQDKSPSLSLAEPETDKILIHCFAGCDTSDVLAAVDLSMEDLFPDNARDLHFKPLYLAVKHKKDVDKQEHDLLMLEATLDIYQQDLNNGKKFTPAENKKYADMFLLVKKLKG